MVALGRFAFSVNHHCTLMMPMSMSARRWEDQLDKLGHLAGSVRTLLQTVKRRLRKVKLVSTASVKLESVQEGTRLMRLDSLSADSLDGRLDGVIRLGIPHAEPLPAVA